MRMLVVINAYLYLWVCVFLVRGASFVSKDMECVNINKPIVGNNWKISKMEDLL